MLRHTTSGRWGLGLFFTLFTVLIWGFLPLILKIMLISLDPFTMSWYRFVIATGITAIAVWQRGNFKLIGKVAGWYGLIFLVASIGFASAYVMYPFGLGYISPSAAQVVNQISLLFILCGGLLFFHERLSVLQVAGLTILLIGILLFFNENLEELWAGGSTMIPGILWVIAAAVGLSLYTLTQKQLLQILPTDVILFLIYLAGTLLTLPFIRFESLFLQSTPQFILLNISAVISLIAFITLVEGMKHLEVNRVTMLLAIVPLTTVAAMAVSGPLMPGLLKAEQLNGTSILGAILVVVGSMLGNIRKKYKSK